jgi:type I restriction enzyme S subunit
VAEIEKQFTRLDAGVSALKRVQANLKRYRAAVLKAACEGTLVETKAKWPQKQIVTAIQTMDQGWSPRCEREPSDNDATWAVIKTTAIQNLRFVEIENKKLPEALKPRPHLELQAGDLLVTRAGPRNRVGVACLVKSTRPRLMLCDKAYRLRCKPNVAHPAFLELVLNTPHIVDEVNKLKTGISDSGVNLTQKRFGELLIPLPPLAEQKRIVEEVERRLSVVEELEAVVSSNLQRATRLRQSILQKAFSGNLVAQQTVSHGEKPQLKPLRRHFARAVLSAEIVGQLHSEPTFGRIKHQKILYLCEYIAQMEEIQGQYHREAAGPLDNKLIYANEAELERQSWYKTTTKSSYGHSYQTMLKAGGHRKYLERFGAEKLLRINQLIELMRTWNTDRCEIFATVYAAWNDLILWKKEPTPKAILHEILNRWNETKQRIPESRWLKAIEWMKQNGFEPTGFGVPTTKPE